MEWRTILVLAPLGALLGLVSLFRAWPFWVELVLWALVGIVWIAALHFRVQTKPFWHGFATALIGGFAGVVFQAVFAGTYLTNNPAAAQAFDADPQNPSLATRAAILGSGLLFATAYALIVGLLTWASRDWGAREPEDTR